jgi:mannose-6-phosphate isomerase-like protein (cupin superfamily)
MAAKGVIAATKDGGTIVDVLGIVKILIKIPSARTGGAIAVFEEQVPAGYGVPYHVHHNEDEMFHILEGMYQIWIGTETLIAHVGDTIMLPRGVHHTFRNISQKTGRTLNTYSPGGFDEFVEILARMPVDTDLTDLGAFGERYGIHYTSHLPWEHPGNAVQLADRFTPTSVYKDYE